VRLELGPGKALVGDDGVTVQLDPFKHLGRDLALGGVGRGQLKSR